MTEAEYLACVKAYKILLISLYGTKAYNAPDALWTAFKAGWLQGKTYE